MEYYSFSLPDTSSVLHEGAPEEEMADKDDDEDDDAVLKVAEADVTHPSVAPRLVGERENGCQEQPEVMGFVLGWWGMNR